MPNIIIDPSTYVKILTLAYLKESSALTLQTMKTFFENDGGKLIINGLAQYGTYVATTAFRNVIKPELGRLKVK